MDLTLTVSVVIISYLFLLLHWVLHRRDSVIFLNNILKSKCIVGNVIGLSVS